MIERKREVIEETAPTYNFALFRIEIGVAVALISIFVFSGNFILPVDIIAVGVIALLIAKNRREK